MDAKDDFQTEKPAAEWLSLAVAFRVVAVLSLAMGGYLFFEALQYASVAGPGVYITAALRLGIAVVIALFLLLGEKVCRYLDGE